LKPISYKRHRFPADVIRQAVWLYFRFTMSFRDVEDCPASAPMRQIEGTLPCRYTRHVAISSESQHSLSDEVGRAVAMLLLYCDGAGPKLTIR